MADPFGTLLFSDLERPAGWRRVTQDGLLLGVVPATPVDPFAPGCSAMGGLATGQIWIAASAYFWRMDADFTNIDGGVAFVSYVCGSNSTYVYVISVIVPTFTQAVLFEIDPTDWSITRTFNIPSGGIAPINRIAFGNLTVNADATIAYYTSLFNAATGVAENYTIVHRHDLTNDVALSDFVTGTTGAGGLLPLPNGDVIVGWTDPSVCTRYDASGAVVLAYAQGAYGALQSILSLGVNNSFWVTSPPSSGLVNSTMYEFDVDSGSLLHNFDNPEDGYNWIAPFSVLGGDVAPTTATIEVVKVTDPPSDPQTFTFTTTNLSPGTFSLLDGQTQTFSGLDAGAGYGVSEDVVANWGTVYSVSNGSPHDNISVGSGETVTVTVTNTFAGDCIETEYAKRRLRRAPHLNRELKLNYHNRFQLDVEPGFGTTGDPTTAPVIWLKWTDTNGQLWSSFYPMSAGIAGDYTKRLVRNRLGKARDRVYEVSTTDAAPWNLLAAYLDVTPGTK